MYVSVCTLVITFISMLDFVKQQNAINPVCCCSEYPVICSEYMGVL